MNGTHRLAQVPPGVQCFVGDEARRRREAGGGLYLIGIKDTVQEQLAESGALKTIGGANLFDSKTEAIAEIYRRLDRDVCRTCHAQVFRECAPARVEASGHPHPLIHAGAQS